MANILVTAKDTLMELERRLHAEIPVTRAMGITLTRYDEHGLALAAPLTPNLNHKQTAFGGSLNSLTTLACWGLIQLLVHDRGQSVTVVIQESSVQFLKPVMRDYEAVCPLPSEKDTERFLRTLDRKGRARLALDSSIHANGEIACRFRGVFVAYDRQRFKGFDAASVV